MIFYCNSCKKEVSKPKKKPIKGVQINVWIIVIIATLGFGLIPFLIHKFLIKRRRYCPDCLSRVEIREIENLVSDSALMHVFKKKEPETKSLEKKEPEKEREKKVETVVNIEIINKPVETNIIINESGKEKEKETKKEKNELKHCNFCQEKIEKNAKICTHCGVELID